MNMNKILSVLALIPLLYACEPAPVSAQSAAGSGIGKTIGTMSGYSGEYMPGYVGQIIQAKGDVLYQADNHDVADLVKTPDGKFAVKFIRPGRVVVTILRRVAQGKFTATNYGFLVKGQAQSSSLTGNYATNQVPGRMLVSADQLANRSLLHWNLTDEQYQQCYNVAYQFAKKYQGYTSKREILKGLANDLRSYFDNEVKYSAKAPHFLDAYGFFITKQASCQGGTCAVGMCLNILGIEYEHVNHNKWTHQWTRVPMEDGTYWICDAYGGPYAGPEPEPYRHPYVN